MTIERRLVRDPNFMKFWVGQTISVFGTAITGLALPLTAANVLNASPAQMGFLNAAATLPFLLVGLFAGVWIDRARRRPILIGADLSRMLLLAVIPLGMAFGWLRIELLYAVVLLVGVAQVFFDVAYQAFLPSLVGREHLVEGNSKLEVSSSAAQWAGPGLAGLLVRLIGAPFAIALDAISYLASALSLLIIRTPEAQPPASAARPGIWREIGEGLQVVFGNRILWSIAGCTGTFNLFYSILNAGYVLYLTRDLGLSPEVIGLIFTASAPGALLGALVTAPVAARVGLGPAIVGSTLVGGASALLIPLARGPIGLVVALQAAAGFLAGISNVMYNVNQVSLRQAITPGRLLGRMNASMRFLVWGTMPVGSLIGGAIGQAVGVRQAILVGAVGAFFSFLWVFLSPVRALRAQPAPAED